MDAPDPQRQAYRRGYGENRRGSFLRAGEIDEKTALLRMEPQKLDELLHPVFDKAGLKRANVMAKGLPASPGAATGG